MAFILQTKCLCCNIFLHVAYKDVCFVILCYEPSEDFSICGVMWKILMGSSEKTLTNSLSVQVFLVPNRTTHPYKCKILAIFSPNQSCQFVRWNFDLTSRRLSVAIFSSKINYSPRAALCAMGWTLSYGSNFPINILPQSPPVFSTLLLLFLWTKNRAFQAE